ncbi:MAG: YceI family protein [Roseovarius sp.]
MIDRRTSIRLCLGLLALPAISSVANAAPERYQLDTARSKVAFFYKLNGADMVGAMPVASARLSLDLETLGASDVEVELDAQGAQAGAFFATEAMRSPSVLDTARHPRIIFQSTRITGNLQSATMTGELTLRGVTRPIRLAAQLGRAPGTDLTQRDDLIVLLEGSLSRSAFGATGYAGMVGDQIGIRISARVLRGP